MSYIVFCKFPRAAWSPFSYIQRRLWFYVREKDRNIKTPCRNSKTSLNLTIDPERIHHGNQDHNVFGRLSNLLQSCIDKKAHLVGKHLHAFIFRNGLSSDTFLSNRLIELYSKCGNIDSAHSVFDKIPQKGIFSWNAILGVHCKAGNLHYAQELFMEMPERNAVSWNTLISALVRSGFEHKAMDAYDSMILEGHVPTHFTLASVFSAFGVLLASERGRTCHGLAIKIGLDKNMYVGNALLCMYAKCGLISDAIQVFGDMPEPNEVTFTAMMGGLAQMDSL